jgi:ABC-2 type transport system ATP-binding protein
VLIFTGSPSGGARSGDALPENSAANVPPRAADSLPGGTGLVGAAAQSDTSAAKTAENLITGYRRTKSLMSASSPSLSIRGLRKSYGSVLAVDGIDRTASPGECFGLLGPNGAGKTTTIEICEGLTPADAGVVEVLGLRWDRNARELRQRLGVQLQETQLAEKLTVGETIRLFRSFYRRGQSLDDVIAMVQLEEKRDARVGNLSGGQKQRLAMACALVGDPELLFLDEPTTGLDPQARRQLWDLIARFKTAGRTIILTTHYMDEAERLCDRIAIMDHGRIIALGTPRELIDSLGAAHVLEFALASGAVQKEELRRIDGVTGVRTEDSSFLLQVSEPHRTVPLLLADLAARGASLAELRIHSATLEDVFVSLTGRRLRDA